MQIRYWTRITEISDQKTKTEQVSDMPEKIPVTDKLEVAIVDEGGTTQDIIVEKISAKVEPREKQAAPSDEDHEH